MKISILNVIQDITRDVYQMFMGLFGALIAFFEPTLDALRVLVVFFVLDVIFGVWNARKNDGKKFQAKIIWEKTIPKMLVSFLIIISAHMLDCIAPLKSLTITSFVAWFICGVVLSSVWENFYKITKWGAIEQAKEKISEVLKSKTKKE